MGGVCQHVLNVNIPDVDNACEIKGRKITALGHSQIARPVHHVVDPRGRDAYWLSLRKRQYELSEIGDNESSLGQSVVSQTVLSQQTASKEARSLTMDMTDNQAVAAGYISLSPVRLHHTPAATLEKLSKLVL